MTGRRTAAPVATEVATLLLAAVAGSVDVLAFGALGQVFASVMTGNLVLLGIALERTSGTQVVATAAALGGYVVGVLAASLIARREHRPDAARPAWLEAALVAGLVIGWEVLDGPPSGETARNVLLGLAAAAMGVQSVASARLPGGASTTYFTSTLTGVIADLGRHRRLRAWSGTRLVALVAGATMTAWVLSRAPRYAVVVPAVSIGLALLILHVPLSHGPVRTTSRTS